MDTVDEAGKRQKMTRVMRSLAEKRAIVEEALRPGASVAAVARQHGVNANLLFGWRRLYEQGLLASHTRMSALVPVVASTSEGTAETAASVLSTTVAPSSAASGVIEIALPSGTRLWIRGAVDVTVVTAVCQTLDGRC